MRLIDADRLAQEIATIMPSRIEVNLIVDAQPDVVIRCKDCKYWLPMNRFQQDYHPDRGECELNCWVRDSDWFCADGGKRE